MSEHFRHVPLYVLLALYISKVGPYLFVTTITFAVSERHLLVGTFILRGVFIVIGIDKYLRSGIMHFSLHGSVNFND